MYLGCIRVAILTFTRRQIDDIFWFFPEDKIWHLMQIVSI